MTKGLLIAIIGAALTAIIPGIGSAIGVQMGGKASAGVVSEKPNLFNKLIILQALPGTQGFYGFIIAVVVLAKLNIMSGDPLPLTLDEGWAYVTACMPTLIIGFVSAILQAKVSVSAIHMTAKQPNASSKGMTMTAMVETYAILALLSSILITIGL